MQKRRLQLWLQNQKKRKSLGLVKSILTQGKNIKQTACVNIQNKLVTYKFMIEKSMSG